jgi:putative (di)nucleoside polyphosphate hydrolase
VEIISCTRGWLRYRLPRRMVRQNSHPVCVGQKQKWFLLRMLSPDALVSVGSGGFIQA